MRSCGLDVARWLKYINVLLSGRLADPMKGPSSQEPNPAKPPIIIGRYALFDDLASGGMASVHLGRLLGPIGFSRTVAVKRLHPHHAADQELAAMFLEEARLASRIEHPNVVSTIDTVSHRGEVFIVMEYVHGETLATLLRSGVEADRRIETGVAVSVLSGVLHGLHAAHEAKSERREPLGIVHRDVSPQNVIVGVDGVARVLDFGLAKATRLVRRERTGGKLTYMSPEQLNGRAVDRRTDVFAAGVMLWEALAGRRLFDGSDAGEIIAKVLTADLPPLRSVAPDLSGELDEVVMKSLERDPERRFQTAREFAVALEAVAALASAREVGEWVEECSQAVLELRRRRIADIERESVGLVPQGAASDEPLEARSSDVPEVPDASDEPSVSGPRLRRRETASAPGVAGPRVGVAAPEQSRRRLFLLALGASLVGGVFALVMFHFGPETVVRGKAARGTEAAGSSMASAQPASSASTTLATPISIEDLPMLEPPDAGARGTGDPVAPTAVPGSRLFQMPNRPASTRTDPAPPASAPSAVSCDPPWAVDDRGIRRPKRECL
jgi:eukaryotic-like serine/threonine-protein kinase